MIDAQKVSKDAARQLSDYYKAKLKRLTVNDGSRDSAVATGQLYMAMLGGTIAVVVSVLEAIEQNNPDLAKMLRGKIVAQVVGKDFQ